MNNKLLTRLLLLSGMIALLVMSLLFDIAAVSLQVVASQGTGLEPLLVLLVPILHLVVVLGGMLLFWYLITSPGGERLVSWVFLAVGLLLSFLTPLIFYLPVPMSIYGVAQFAGPGTFLFLSAVLLAVAGALTLALKREARQEEIEPAEEAEL